MKLYTIKETAEMLSVHPRTIRRWIADGKIKTVRVMNLPRIEEKEVQRIIEKSE